MKQKFINKKPFFIAEISANHNGLLSNAKKLIFEAKRYGADAVKFQTYLPETMTINCTKKDFKINTGIWKGKTLWELYKKSYTPFKWHKSLFDHAKKVGITSFSTPFDETAVELLEKLNCPFYKVASFEMNDIPLIKRIAQTRKPIIISTGLANLDEIDLAFYTAKKNGSKKIVLLYCVSNYPSRIEDFNLNNINILKNRYKCMVGFSDHSNNPEIAMAAIASGAEVIEKHIALSNQKKGFDIKFSIKGKQILNFRKLIDQTYDLLGKKIFFRNKSEKTNLQFRRSIYIINDIRKGEKFSFKNIKRIRPGYGGNPKYFNKLIGKKSPINLQFGKPLKNRMILKLLNNL